MLNRDSTRWTLIIPTNSLYVLTRWNPSLKIQRIAGESSAGGTSESSPILMEDGTIIGKVSETSRRFGTLEYNFNRGEKTIDSIYESFVSETDILDVKIKELVYVVRNLDLGYSKETIKCTFNRYTLHTGIYQKLVANGEIPHQEIVLLQQAIYEGMKEIPEGIIKPPSFLMLKTEPDIHDDGPGIWALRARERSGEQYMQLIHEGTKDWILKEFSYKPRGGPRS